MKIKDLNFTTRNTFESDILHAATVFVKTNYGVKITRITVLDRLTGFGWRDVETGYRDVDGRFWLVSGDFDIRDYPDIDVNDAIRKIKQEANNNKGSIMRKCFDVDTREKVGLL